jgi:hypothetical protein
LAFAEAVGSLIADSDQRNLYGAAARRFVSHERDLDHAAQRMQTALAPLLSHSGA